MLKHITIRLDVEAETDRLAIAQAFGRIVAATRAEADYPEVSVTDNGGRLSRSYVADEWLID